VVAGTRIRVETVLAQPASTLTMERDIPFTRIKLDVWNLEDNPTKLTLIRTQANPTITSWRSGSVLAATIRMISD